MPAKVNSSIVDVLPGRLGWAPEQVGTPCDTHITPVLELCQHGADACNKVGEYRVYHYPPSACGRAFGPLDLESLLRFCRGLKATLDGRLPGAGPLVLGTPSGDESYRANAAVLLGAYLILHLEWSASSVASCLGRAEADSSFVCSWARADRPEPRRVLRVFHCWQGIELARQQRWLASGCLRDDVEAEKACSSYHTMLARYDTAWIIPKLLMVGADPTTVICDPNPITCSSMFPPESESMANTFSDVDLQDGEQAKRQSSKTGAFSRNTSSTMLTREESACDSCDTVCKDYTDVATEQDSNAVDVADDGRDFVSFLQQSGVGMVVRANFDDEAGLPSNRCGYTDRALESFGICQSKICLVDTNGGLPEASDVARMLHACDGFMEDKAWAGNAVMVHCKGGFGRSVVLACCLAISRLDISGAALLGWVRIVRPGAFTVQAQELFIKSLKGRKDVLRYAKLSSDQPGCSFACQVQ